MNQQLDLARGEPALGAPTHDDDLAPGRRSRSAGLAAPAHPITGGLIQRKARDANGVADGADQAIADASSSSGAALPDTAMRKFESSLATDLSSVRVHTGASSAAAADAVGAKAYTLGQDIHFGPGQYDPSSTAGQHLLAHEVAHTVQQRGGSPTRQNKLEVSNPFDAAEVEADTAADAMVSGAPVTIASASGIARKVMRDAAPAAAGPAPAPGGASPAADSGAGAEGSAGPVSGSFKVTAESDGKVGLSGSVTVTSPAIQGSVFSGHMIIKASLTGEAELAGGAVPATQKGGPATPEGGSATPESGPAAPESGPKPSAGVDLSPKAQSAALKCVQQLAADQAKANSEVESIEFEESAEGGNDKEAKDAKVGGKVAIKFKGGLQSYVDVELLAVKDAKEGDSNPFSVDILKTTIMPMSISLDLGEKVIDQVKLSGKMGLEVGGDIQPDKTRLAIWIAGKAGPALLERLGIGATSSVMLRSIAGMMASTEFNIAVFAVYITIEATLATLQEGDDMEATHDQAMDACYGYKSGFELAVMNSPGKEGNAAWFAKGINDGNAALQAQATTLAAQYSGWNFTPQELIGAMRDGFASSESAATALGRMIQDTAWWAIKADYINAWRKSRSWAENTFTDTDSQEDMLAVQLGFSGKSAVPPPSNGPVAANAGSAGNG